MMDEIAFAAAMRASARETRAAMRDAEMLDFDPRPGCRTTGQRTGKRPPSAAAQEAMRMLRAGMSRRDVREATGITQNHAWRLGAKVGAVEPADPVRAQAADMVRDGVAHTEIARVTGLSRHAVGRIARKLEGK